MLHELWILEHSVLFIIAPKQETVPINWWMVNKLWYTNTKDYCPAIKRTSDTPNNTGDLKNIFLSERSQNWLYAIWLQLYEIPKKKQIMTNSKSVIAKGLEMRERCKGLFGVLGRNVSWLCWWSHNSMYLSEIHRIVHIKWVDFTVDNYTSERNFKN